MERRLDVFERDDRQMYHELNDKINWLKGQLELRNKEIEDMKLVDDRYEHLASTAKDHRDDEVTFLRSQVRNCTCKKHETTSKDTPDEEIIKQMYK